MSYTIPLWPWLAWENKTQHWHCRLCQHVKLCILQWLLLLKCHLTRMQSLSRWFIPELVVRFTVWQSVSDSNAGSSVRAIWVPHVIKTWLFFRILLLTISTISPTIRRERVMVYNNRCILGQLWMQSNHVSCAHMMNTGRGPNGKHEYVKDYFVCWRKG